MLKDKQDETSIRLVFANQTEEDILLRPELDAFALDPRFEVHYVLSRPKSPKEWVCGSTGRWAFLLLTVTIVAECAKQEYCLRSGRRQRASAAQCAITHRIYRAGACRRSSVGSGLSSGAHSFICAATASCQATSACFAM